MGSTELFQSDLHWSEENQMYCDVNVNDEGKCLVVITFRWLIASAQTSPIMFATKAIYHYSPSSFHFCRLTHHILDQYLTCFATLNTYGPPMVYVACLHPILNLVKARTIGKGLYGFR